MATRREFLAGALSACALPAFAAAPAAPRLLSAAKLGRRDGAVVWSADGLRAFDLPARGHGAAHLPDGRLLVMSRRPGLFATMLDPDDLSVSRFAPDGAWRFSGHAAATPELLATAEFDAGSFEAAVTARDPRTGAARETWRLGGIEPHELVFAQGGARLVAALGGLIKDGGVAGPAFNPGGIDSALLEIDPSSGRVLARHKFGAASLSLRHLAVSPDGATVAVAAQDQDVTITRPLVGLLRPGKEIEALSWPDPHACDFRSYVGSVAIDAGGRFIAAASPRGSVVGVWRLADGRWLGGLAIADVCGVTAAREAGTFWASTGLGSVLKIAADGPRIDAQWHADAGFDNHLLSI